MRRAEVFVLIRRTVDELVVHGSDARVSIDTQRRPARVHLSWPDFTLGAEAAAVRPLTHEEVVQRIVEEVGAFSRCGWAGDLCAQIGWIEGSAGPEGATTGRYIPGLHMPSTASNTCHRPAGLLWRRGSAR